MTNKRDPVNENLNDDQMDTTARRDRYHHGDLRTALIEAGAALLAETGVEGFSLRALARRVGVSPGAPAHHFGDVNGLFTAMAARGFAELTARLNDADASASDRAGRVRAQGRAYVAFALEHRAAFDLMWRCALLRMDAPELVEAGAAAFEVLRKAIDGPDPGAPSPRVFAAWSLVHGYARLAIDGAINPASAELLDPVLATLDIGD